MLGKRWKICSTHNLFIIDAIFNMYNHKKKKVEKMIKKCLIVDRNGAK